MLFNVGTPSKLKRRQNWTQNQPSDAKRLPRSIRPTKQNRINAVKCIYIYIMENMMMMIIVMMMVMTINGDDNDDDGDGDNNDFYDDDVYDNCNNNDNDDDADDGDERST